MKNSLKGSRLLSWLMTVAMVITLMPSMAYSATESTTTATDSTVVTDYSVKDNVDTSLWYHEGIDYVLEKGMMKGVADDAFAPDETTTRAMIVTILYRLEGEPAAEAASFKDVEAGSWYEAAVNWAAANGIVNGYDADTFAPTDGITREQIATILYRYARFKGKDVSQTADLSNFTDAGSISDWAKDAMTWAAGTGLIKGMSETILEPQGSATRAQVATLMMRLCEVVTDEVFAGGTGTVENPWQIATAEQLNRVRDDLTANYVLIDDIDLSGYENWMPIGNFRSLSDAPEDAEIPHPDFAFTGTFDGAGHTISNLNISSEAQIGAGLFGCASGTENGAASIGNFTLKNVNVSGFYLVGGAVGLQFMNCPVSDIHLVGDNKLTGMQGIGGIVGTGFDLISDCSATADITVQGDDGACAGLIAGGTTMSSIKNCEVTGGSVIAEGNETWGFGALCGAPWGAAEITDCKVRNTVITASGENNRLIGGLIGFGGTYDPTAPAQITGCTVENVTMIVSETTDSVGGLIGAGKEMMEGSDVMSSFSVSGCKVSGSITGGGNHVDAVVGDPACAVSVDCEGGMKN